MGKARPEVPLSATEVAWAVDFIEQLLAAAANSVAL
jgi:hypothetical protein